MSADRQDALNTSQPSRVSVPIRFLGEDETPIQYANAFSLQNPGSGPEFVLTASQIVPPILLGTPEEQRQQIIERGYVSGRVVARLLLTPEHLRELVQLATATLDQFERQQRGDDA